MICRVENIKRKRILVPLDGTERSLHSLDLIKSIYSNKEVEIILMNVKELIVMNGLVLQDELRRSEEVAKRILSEGERLLKGYEVKTYFTYGYAGEEILKTAKEEFIDVIIMTKSTKKGFTRVIGAVTTSVVKKASCIVMIVPE